jgi:hypothetical protein
MFEKLKAGAASALAGKVEDTLRGFNDTIPTMQALGLSISDITFKMGILPEIGARLTGSVEALDQGKIKDLIQRHQGNKAVTVILEALRTAANFKGQLSKVGFKGIKVDVKLGLLPNVEVGLIA